MVESGTPQPQSGDSGRAPAGGDENARAQRAQRWIYVGATVTTLGICLSLTQAKDIAGPITMIGLASALIGLHRFGRSGADRPA